MAAPNLLEPWASPPNIFSGAPVQAFMSQMQAAQNWRPERGTEQPVQQSVPQSPLSFPVSEYTTPSEMRQERISQTLGWDTSRPGQEFLRRMFLSPQGAFSTFALATPRASSLAASAPRFSPDSTVRGYHGTSRWDGVGEPRTPFWLSESPSYARTYARERGTTYPYDVDTSNYLRIREGGPLESLDLSMGIGRRLEGGGRDWLADFARLTGRSGIRRENDWYNRGPSLMVLDPSTVRPAADSRPVPHRKSK